MEKNSSNYSDFKIFHHPEKLNDIINKKRTAPIYLRIKPTNICNQDCYYCTYKNSITTTGREVKKNDFIPFDKMTEMINDFENIGVKAITLSGGGEPLFYKYIIPTLEMLFERNFDVSVVTNAQSLKGEVATLLYNAKWIRVSLDSANEETYKKIRNVNTFNEVIDNIKNFCLNKNENCDVGINFVVSKDNYTQIYDMAKLAKEIGVNNIKFAGIVFNEGTREYHEEICDVVLEQIQRAKEDFVDESFNIVSKYAVEIKEEAHQREYDNCHISQIFAVVGADCNVYMCHQLAYTERGTIGSVAERSFKDLWFDKDTVQKIQDFNCKVNCDVPCVFDNRNILLDKVVNLDKNHINFI